MKQTLTIVGLLLMLTSQAQNVKIKVGTTISAAILTSTPDQLRTQNGLLSHFVSGTVDSFGSTDQWIGIVQPISGGAPLTNLYGARVQ